MRPDRLLLVLALVQLACEQRQLQPAPWSADAWILLITEYPDVPQISLYAPGEAVIVPSDALGAEILEYPMLAAPGGEDPKICGVRAGSDGLSLPPAARAWRVDPDTGGLDPIDQPSPPVSWNCVDNPCLQWTTETVPLDLPSEPLDVAAVDRRTAYLGGRRLAGTSSPMIARVDGSAVEILGPSRTGTRQIVALTWDHHEQLWGVGTAPVNHVVRFDMEGKALELPVIDVRGDRNADADASPDGSVLVNGSDRLLRYAAGSTTAEEIPIREPRRVVIAAPDQAFVLDNTDNIWVWDGQAWTVEVDRASFLFELSLEDLDASGDRVVGIDAFGSLIARDRDEWSKLTPELPPLPGRYEAVALLGEQVIVSALSRGLVLWTGEDWCVLQDGWDHTALDAQAEVVYSLARDPTDSSWKLVRVTAGP